MLRIGAADQLSVDFDLSMPPLDTGQLYVSAVNQR
jgi:hypothetical protein